jgi:hypothetical protein
MHPLHHCLEQREGVHDVQSSKKLLGQGTDMQLPTSFPIRLDFSLDRFFLVLQPTRSPLTVCASLETNLMLVHTHTHKGYVVLPCTDLPSCSSSDL